MKILYIGQIDQGGTCFDRMNSLKRIGHNVIGFNVSPFQSRFKLLRSMQWRFHTKFLLKSLNIEIQRKALDIKNLDMIWIDKGIWIFPETLTHIKKYRGCVITHYTPDAQLLMNRSIHFINSIKIYDHLITTKKFEIDHYHALGARNVIYATQSYCPIRYETPKKDIRFSFDIGFISDYKPHYGQLISHLSDEVDNIGIWGPKWQRAANINRIPSKLVQGTGLWNEEYVNALASFKIGLGLLSKYIPEQHTTRTFEIPATGTFLLAERTPEHQDLFVEGVEAEFFDTPAEMIIKAKYYLKNDNARQEIAERGHRRCINSGYDNDSVLLRVLNEMYIS